jgi:uncharacterized membrane protein HdeD (DUF308 family)
MAVVLAANWWSLVIRGVISILLGIVALVWPGITLGALVLLFGAYALIDGIVSLVGVWRASKAHERWGALLLEGFLGIAAAVVTIAWPGITVIVLIYVIAAWAIITGIFEIMAAIRLRKHISNEWLLLLAGVASVVFGILMMGFPITGALVIAIWFGVYALIFGGTLIGLGLRLRAWSKGHGSSAAVVGFP